MRFTHALLSGSLMVSSAVSTVMGGPINSREVPARSRAIVHIDIEALLASEIGEFALGHADGLEDLDEVRREIGLDPLKDIRDITVCLLSDDEEDVVILATVSDALENVLDRLEDFGEELNHDVRRRFGGDLHTFDADGKRMGALVREGRGGYRVAISPDADLLRIVGETIDGDRESIRDQDHDFGRLRARDGAFVQLVALDISKLPFHDDLPGGVAKMLKGVVAQIGEDGGRVYCNARVGVGSAEDAENLVRMGQGLLAMLHLAKNLDEGHDEELRTAIHLAKGLRIERDGAIVEVTLEIDSDDVRELIENEGRRLGMRVERDDDERLHLRVIERD